MTSTKIEKLEKTLKFNRLEFAAVQAFTSTSSREPVPYLIEEGWKTFTPAEAYMTQDGWKPVLVGQKLTVFQNMDPITVDGHREVPYLELTLERWYRVEKPIPPAP